MNGLNIPVMTPPTPAAAGKYGVANSAGLISIWREGPAFPSLKSAKVAARAESSRGWLGECWPVRFALNVVRTATAWESIGFDEGKFRVKGGRSLYEAVMHNC